MKTTNRLSLFKEEALKAERINICLPALVAKMIDKQSAETGESKADIWLRAISTELPKDFQTVVGDDVFNELLRSISLFYKDLYNNSEVVSYVVFVREHLLLMDDTLMDDPQRKLKICRHIFEIAYPNGDTVSKNAFIKVISQNNYLRQIMNSAFDLIRDDYNEAVNKMILSLGEYM